MEAPILESPAPPDFEALYAAECGWVWNTLRRLGVPPADVEDAAQDVFVVVYRRLGDYDPARPLRPWLFGIAFRVVSERRRRQRRSRESADDEAIDAAHEEAKAEHEIAARQSRELVLGALLRVPLERRAVFVMHEIDGLPAPEIATALGIPLNTAYSRLRLARRDFAAAVNVLNGGGPR